MKIVRLLLIAILSSISFNSTSQNWDELIKITASDRGWTDNFGSSVDISGDIAIVGAYQDEKDASGGNPLQDAGSVYVFQKNSLGVWQETQKIVASDRAAFNNFGVSVSISGNRAIIGAHKGNSLGGAAYIFEMDDMGVWQEVQKIVASDGGPTSEYFGQSVGISNDYVVVGAYYNSEDELATNTMFYAGAAYIFELDEFGVWQEVQKIVASDRETSSWFGYSVSIDGDHLIVGSHQKDYNAFPFPSLSNAGAAYIFERDDLGVWQETQILENPNNAANDSFGFTVSISNNRALVTAILEDENASGNATLSNAGSAFIFDLNSMGVWELTQKIVASDRSLEDRFGISACLRSDRLIIGTPAADSDALGENFMSTAGCAYIFDLDEFGVWQETQKIVASDRAADDSFGFSLSLSGKQIIVCAPYEDEDASNSNTLSSAGSAYVFCTPNATPTLDSTVLSDVLSDCEVITVTSPTATGDCGNTIAGIPDVDFPITAQGQTTITWTFTDIANNSITQTQMIVIEDLVGPSPDLDLLPEVLSDCDITALTPPTATDNCGGLIVVAHDAILPLSEIGSTVITWTYTDGLENSSTQTQTVTILGDLTAPIPDVAVLSDIIEECEVTSLIAPTAIDNCNGTVVVTNDAILPIQSEGQSVVTWTYTDDKGNFTTQLQNIFIEDVTGPVPDVAILQDVTAECAVTSLIPPTATDNCGGIVMITNDAILPIYTVGVTIVTWSYEDDNGNITTQSQSIVITCDVGLDENTQKTIRVFPNPTQKEVTISSQKMISIELKNLNGTVMLSQKDIFQEFTIDLSSYPSGLYFISIFDGDETLTYEIIKE